MKCDLEHVTQPLCASVASNDGNRINALILAQGSEHSSSSRVTYHHYYLSKSAGKGWSRWLESSAGNKLQTSQSPPGLREPGKNFKQELAGVDFCFRNGSWREKGVWTDT